MPFKVSTLDGFGLWCFVCLIFQSLWTTFKLYWSIPNVVSIFSSRAFYISAYWQNRQSQAKFCRIFKFFCGILNVWLNRIVSRYRNVLSLQKIDWMDVDNSVWKVRFVTNNKTITKYVYRTIKQSKMKSKVILRKHSSLVYSESRYVRLDLLVRT